jgi:hypothetical protein
LRYPLAEGEPLDPPLAFFGEFLYVSEVLKFNALFVE